MSIHSALTEELKERIIKIRLLALDSDGVLTDGGVYLMEDGTEFRRFNIKDGFGLKQVMDAGIQVAIISGAPSSAVVHRGKQLGVSEIHIGVADKMATLRAICARLEIELDQVAYVGDDLPDLPIIVDVGLSCAPRDAVEDVLTHVQVVTRHGGGHGAVRELCDLLTVRWRSSDGC